MNFEPSQEQIDQAVADLTAQEDKAFLKVHGQGFRKTINCPEKIMEEQNKRGETSCFVHIDEAAFYAVPPEQEAVADKEPGFTAEGVNHPQSEVDYDDDADCKAPDNDYIDDGALRFGNNRKKVKGLEAKARRKMAKKSKRRNRK